MAEDIGSEQTVSGNDSSGVSLGRFRRVGIKQLVVLFLSFGFAAGLGFAAFRLTMNWHASRPVPARVWPPIDLSVGLTAKLKTDWNGDTRYQLHISPRTEELTTAFDMVLRSNDKSVREFRIHFYDKAGFEVCDTLVVTTRSLGAENRFIALTANDHFHCSRSDYNQADHWNISFLFPQLVIKKVDAQN